MADFTQRRGRAACALVGFTAGLYAGAWLMRRYIRTTIRTLLRAVEPTTP